VLAFVLAAVVAVSVAPASAGRQVAGVTYCDPLAASPFNSLGALASAASAARGGDREPSGWKGTAIDEVPYVQPGGGKGFRATIPVYIHIFTDGARGDISAQTISQQIAVLNAGFGGFEGGTYTGFSFKLAGVDRTNNADWFSNLNPGTSQERAAKAATHVGGANVLNIWTTDGPSYLGFATFPSWYKRSPQLDGVVIDYKSFPGNPTYAGAYDLGKTVTHEVGHWVGLLHTFQGGCNDKGDYVDDTPAMSIPTRGCPEGKDTCPEPGTDPIHNYMDYSFDSCYDQFTVGQSMRMQQQWLFFRADGGTSVGQ
jgi:hypothetical protein